MKKLKKEDLIQIINKEIKLINKQLDNSKLTKEKLAEQIPSLKEISKNLASDKGFQKTIANLSKNKTKKRKNKI